MLSSDTQDLLARILLALAEGEKNVDDARKELSSQKCYDIQAIFRVLDNNGDSYITPKDIQKYLASHDLEVNLIEIKLFLLFYDQDHDFSLTYGEIFKLIHPGKQFPRIPKYIREEELDTKVDRSLYNLLEKEILMSRILLALLDEIKHREDFNIHNLFHCLKYYACITGDSINVFLKNCGYNPSVGEIRAIVKRLDINKDDIIDFCEFHAFIGFPNCTYNCPCFPCPNCGAKYCEECLQDIPCYLLGCDHKDMNSKMRCTSPEHVLGGNPLSTFSNTFNKKVKYDSRNEDDINNPMNNRNKFPNGEDNNNFNNMNNLNVKFPGRGFMNNSKLGFPSNNITPEQYKILQGLTNPEQLNKFMAISNILDRQNAEGINLTENLSLRLSPIRDFDPKDWGCKNCPCNIHGNPDVPCDCCQCNLCPYESINRTINKEKQKPRLFPKMPLYSYSYTYEPDIKPLNRSDISLSNNTNNSTFMNSPQKPRSFVGNDPSNIGNNKSNKSIPSDDDEKEYEDYMNKVKKLKQTFNQNNQNGEVDPNYQGDEGDNKFNNGNNIFNKGKNNVNNEDNDNEEEMINQDNENIYKKEEIEEIEEIEENDSKNKKKKKKKPKNNQQDNGNIKEDIQNDEPPQNDINNDINNDIPKDKKIFSKTYPYSEPINDNNNNNKNGPLLGDTMTKTIYMNNPNNNFNTNNNNSLIGNNKMNKIKTSGRDEEESEENVTNNIYKSNEQILEEHEKAFIQYLKALIKSEKEIEFAKRDIMRQKDFNAEDAFRLFEVEGSGVITKKDLNFGLKLLGIKPTMDQINIIFNRYDLDGNNYIDYDDFFDMVISFKDEDRKEEERRKPNKSIPNRNKEIFSPRTRELYKKLFLVIIEEEERLEELKQKLDMNQNDMIEIFNKINTDNDGICNKFEFANYCLRNKVCKEKKDAYLAFIRLNRYRDGGLETKEFDKEIQSSVLD